MTVSPTNHDAVGAGAQPMLPTSGFDHQESICRKSSVASQPQCLKTGNASAPKNCRRDPSPDPRSTINAAARGSTTIVGVAIEGDDLQLGEALLAAAVPEVTEGPGRTGRAQRGVDHAVSIVEGEEEQIGGSPLRGPANAGDAQCRSIALEQPNASLMRLIVIAEL